MLIRPKLSKAQYKYFSSALKTISTGIILGVSTALFLPETFQLTKPISIDRFIFLFLIGLLILVFGGIIEKKGGR